MSVPASASYFILPNSYCVKGSHHLPVEVCSGKKLESNTFFLDGVSQHNVVKT